MHRHVFALATTALLAGSCAPAAAEAGAPEDVFAGELVRYPGPYAFLLGKSALILTRDAELEALSSDPERRIDLSLTFQKEENSLKGICEAAKAAGQRTLVMSFDHFFKQYRPGQDTPRRLMPDMDEYIGHVAKISRFAASYGLGMELSLLTPLEIGPSYRARTGESGVWMHYRKGLRDSSTGRFSVQLWRQRQWVNNKGPVAVEDAGVRVFAFREFPVHGTSYAAVNPREIVDITETAKVEVWEGTAVDQGGYRAVRVRVFGEGRAEIGPRDRVLVVQQYKTPEMDYFSAGALSFLTSLLDKYVDAGVKFNGLYADEMHIQQDWHYFGHHDHGEFALRYVSDGLRKRFAAAYGAEYEDLAKYLVYFCRGQEDTRNDLAAKDDGMHAFGASPEDVRRTALFRARYYRMLQDGVVELFVAAKRHLEARMGHRLEARAHATWAESPTIDSWNVGRDHLPRHQYEYTSNFVWSCTVHQAAAACHDYFKWGEFLTGNGNDHAEGGWLDRNYFALALGCSTGIVNAVPYSYAAHWGSPNEVGMRHGWLQAAYGTSAGSPHAFVQDMQHRDVDVLLLYPLDLVSADERFGSWIVQYGYANYLTAAKVCELGKVGGGVLEIAGRRFTTVVALFEPNPPRKLLGMLAELAAQGGRVVWAGPPPLVDFEGAEALGAWQELFGAAYAPDADMGKRLPGRRVQFEGALAAVAPQTILTDFLVDRVYPVTPREGAAAVARVQGTVAGVRRALPSGGSATFLGFRPRDDQSQSLGYDERTLFSILSALGAYRPTGKFADVNDNTEHLSRTGDHLCCRFPNGAVSIAPHLRTYVESWPGGFARNAEQDARAIAANPPPSPALALRDFKVAGHAVTYAGHGPVTFRVDAAGTLVGFAGHASCEIAVDGRAWKFAQEPLGAAAWAPVREDCRVPGGAVMHLTFDVRSACEVRVPAAGLPAEVRVIAQGAAPGSRGAVLESRREGDALVVKVGPQHRGAPLFVVPK